jgi:hypothetical protein
MGEHLIKIPPVEPTPNLNKASKPAETLRITGKVRTAIEAMVWDGLPRAKAAEKAGISEHGLYKALCKPPVKAFYLRELDVLRTSERARSVFRMAELRDQDDNKMVAFNAAKELAGPAESAAESGVRQAMPGLVVQINVQSGASVPDPMRVVHAVEPITQPSD